VLAVEWKPKSNNSTIQSNHIFMPNKIGITKL
jgi:hypothetical protein